MRYLLTLQIADYFKSGGNQPEEFSVGLHSSFQPLDGHDIGQFPGLESEQSAVALQTTAP